MGPLYPHIKRIHHNYGNIQSTAPLALYLDFGLTMPSEAQRSYIQHK